MVLLHLLPLNCVQQASISNWVNSSTFTTGQHVCVLLLLARGLHCYAGRVIRWALPRISSFEMIDSVLYGIIYEDIKQLFKQVNTDEILLLFVVRET